MKNTGWFLKHDKFAGKHKLTPATCLIWRILRRSFSEGVRARVDLIHVRFQAKQIIDKLYDRGTLKHAINQLVEAGIILPIGDWENYRWNVKEIILLSVEDAIAGKQLSDFDKKIPANNLPSKPKAQTPHSTKSQKKKGVLQQQLVYADRICRSVGIVFVKDALYEVASYGVEAITKSVELFKTRSLTSKIGNPQGFVISCLRKKMWNEPSNQGLKMSMAAKIADQYRRTKEWLLDNVGSLPSEWDGCLST